MWLLYPSESDFPYEEEVLRDPLKLQAWQRYLAALAGAPPQKRFSIYERAVRALPGSYKLWRGYLAELLDAVQPLPISDPSYASLNSAFERALLTMHKMPRIWLMYLTSLTEQRRVTRARRAFDRALRSLPVSQHARVWPLYLRLVSLPASPRDRQAVTRLAAALNDDRKSFCSVKGKTRRQLWLDLCDIVARHAADIPISGLNVESVLRSGIRQFTDEVGMLWNSLADYYSRRGLYAKARDVFENGLNAVLTARDFGIIFEGYAQFEQSLLAAKLDASDGEVDNGYLDDGEFWLNGGDDTDFLIARIELLFDRRPKLLNCVLLRQNPHNVEQWRRRVTLFDGDPSTQVSTYVQALKTVDPMKAAGKPHTLWVDFARMYESRNLLDSAEEVFERATQVNFKSVDHLATVWCEWAEMELRHNNFEKALQLMRQATAEPSVEVKKRAAADGNEPVQMKLHKSLRVWSAYVDLEESLGSVESTRDVYDRMLDLKIATPQIILNYASFLEEHKYFEDAFKIYERGVKLFKYPHVREIWAMYLTKFVKRYGNTKLDRARDLFECAIEQTPSQEVKPFYFQYAKMEEDYGLLRRALHVYERAVKAVPDCEKSSIYESYINRAESLGFKEVRKIYEQAIEAGLPDSDLKTLCMRLADREASLGEIDRARRLYTYASEHADLQSDSNFWKKWREFEIMHGNDDTFREMLRIKRTVSLPAQTFKRIKRQRLQ
nr:unnamed protein product [Ananas comosus var. bracteatus]